MPPAKGLGPHLEAVLAAQHGRVQWLDLHAPAASGSGGRTQVQSLHDVLAGQQRLVGSGGPQPRWAPNTETQRTSATQQERLSLETVSGTWPGQFLPLCIQHALPLQLGDTLGAFEGIGSERPFREKVLKKERAMDVTCECASVDG